MVRKTAYMAFFLALALACSYIESLIPFYFGIMGVKLGLTNIIVVLMLYTVGAKEAFGVSVMRIMLAGFMFGNAFSILYSLAGGILSFFVMYGLKRTGKLHMISVSIAGGLSHNVGQLIIAAFIVSNSNIYYYLPVLVAAGILTGLVIGMLSQELIIRLPASIVENMAKKGKSKDETKRR